MADDQDDTDSTEWQPVGGAGGDDDGPESGDADSGTDDTPEALSNIEGRAPAEVSPAEVAEALSTEGVEAADVEAALDLSETDGKPLTGGDGGDGGESGGEADGAPPGAGPDAAASGEAAGGDGDEDDSSESERYGMYAGGFVAVVTVVAVFVGPWRLYDLTFSGSYIPLEYANPPEGTFLAVLAVPAVLALVAAACAAVAYRLGVDEPEEEYVENITVFTLAGPVLLGFVGYLLLMTVGAGGLLLDGKVVAAVLNLVIAAVAVWILTTVELIAIGLYLGVPSFAGAYVGGLVGGVLADG